MAHDHHHGESLRDYFTEQLLTILVCGVFGIAAIQMYVEKKMEFLAPQFHPWVLGGGISIIAMVILRPIVAPTIRMVPIAITFIFQDRKHTTTITATATICLGSLPEC